MSLDLFQPGDKAGDDVTPGYESFFGMSATPFAEEPDPQVFFRSETHANALEILQYEVQRRTGVVVLTGERGAGKTTLCRVLADAADRKAVTAMLREPSPSEHGLLMAVLREFGVMSNADSGGRQVTTEELATTFRDFLQSLMPLDARATVIIDEAHRLSLPALRRVGNLSDDVIHNQQQLQIILVGEPALIATLQSPDVRHLDRRVAVRYQLKPLTEREVRAYVEHRLAVAGTPSTEVFSPAALRFVYFYSGGLPGKINSLCDRALQAAHSAQAARVDKNQIASAAGELGLAPAVARPPSFLRRVFGRSRER